MPTEKDIRKALRKVKDPELNLDLMVLGLVYGIEIVDTHVIARISLTSPFCPAANQILEEAQVRGLALGEMVAKRARDQAAAVVEGKVAIEVVAFDRAGALVGRAGFA